MNTFLSPYLQKFSEKTIIIIAFSGGPDSVFLSEYLLKNGYKNIILCHFNHHMDMRYGANDNDEQFVKNYGEEKNIQYEIGHWETPEQSEEKARNARYLFLENCRKKYNADFIVTGHHKNDVAETVLLQFFRSGGIKSLSGITEYDSKRKLLRPLLHLFKSDILQYLSAKNIKYCTDTSNKENIFTRNFIRNEVFPLLETRFPNIQEHLSTQAGQFKILETEIEKEADIFLEKTNFIISDFLMLMTEIQIAILRKIIIRKEVSRKFLLTFLDFLQQTREKNKSGKKLETKFQLFTIFGDILFIENKKN